MKRILTYATVCSGIECMSAACADLPMRPVFFSEIEPFPCAVLRSHFPNVPNLGDMSKIKVSNDGKEITNGATRIILDERLDVFAGGTPCQDVSVAGKRSGMQKGSGTRSSLAFEFVRLVRELKPRYVLWENVAGVLSDKSFPEFLVTLANCGYGVAYRTLDAQWVRCADIHHKDGRVVRLERAIPQRRRRVWVIGCAGGDVTKAAEILFEHKSIVGDTPPRRRTGQEIARIAQGRNRVHDRLVGGASGDGECVSLEGNGCRPSHRGDGVSVEGVSYTLNAIEQHKVAYGIDQQGGKGHAAVAEGVAPTMCSDSHGTPHGVAYECYENHAQDSRVKPIEVAPTIPQKAGTGGNNLPLAVFNKVSHARGVDGEGETRTKERVVSAGVTFDAMKGFPVADEVSQTQISGSSPGHHVGVVQGLDGYNKTLTGEVSATIRGAANDFEHTHGLVVTNSNGEDVMPTLDQRSASSSGVGAQGDKRGDYIIHSNIQTNKEQN